MTFSLFLGHHPFPPELEHACIFKKSVKDLLLYPPFVFPDLKYWCSGFGFLATE